MQLQLPGRLCAALADAVVGAASIQEAYFSLSTTVSEQVGSPFVLFVRKSSRWERVGGRMPADRERLWRAAIEQLSDDAAKVVRLDDPVAGQATAIVLSGEDRFTLLVEQDWTPMAEALEACAVVVDAGLRLLRQREIHHHAQRWLRRIYRLTKRVGNAGADTLATHIVDLIATMFSAERVSIALFDPSQDCLRIKASRGTPMSVVHDIKIQRGDWVIGRVYETAKAVIVNDVRALPSQSHQNRYRSQAFAVVPLTHRNRVTGVLAVTDMAAGQLFGVSEQFALKTVAGVIGSALAVERTDAEMVRLEHAASVDALTGLLNRAYLDRRLHQELARSQREGNEFAVLMADIDDFKLINDSRGHQAGDAVLKGVGDIMRSAVRAFDVCARWGGDEFAVLMPHSDHASAMACAERIRVRTAEQLVERAGAPRALTLSIGVAVGGAADTVSSVIERADRALYDAKLSGKDAVHSSGGHSSSRARGNDGPRKPDHETVTTGGVPPRLPYILAADANHEREAVYRAAADEFRLGLLIARSGEQAKQLIEQFGPPVLLVVDMTTTGMRGVTLLEHAYATLQPEMILAFSSSRDLRQYSGNKPDGLRLDVLRSDAPAAVITAVLERALRSGPARLGVSAERDVETNRRQEVAAEELSARALEIVPAPGVAVYLKAPGEEQLRATVTWHSDAGVARAHHHLPAMIDRVLKTAEPVIAGAVGGSDGDVPGNAFGLLGTPIKQDGQVVGAVCAFGDEALKIAADAVAKLDAAAVAAFAWEAESEGHPVQRVPPTETASITEARREPARPSRPQDDRFVDPDWQLTLLERKRAEFVVARELALARREQRQLSVVLFDIAERGADRTTGTQLLDEELLNGVAETLVKAIRQSDLPIQWSGNELLLVLPGLAGPEARTVAERVRAAMQAGGRQRVAVAGGVAELNANEQFASVVQRAREKLTLALERGHNRVS